MVDRGAPEAGYRSDAVGTLSALAAQFSDRRLVLDRKATQ
jgi:hypothetical protein